MPPKRKETGETSYASSKRKRVKKQQPSTDDIISSLPDAILHHILSFLDMKHAVQTSILSKRWTNLWASLGSLTFNADEFYSLTTDQCDGFLDFVDQVLHLRDNYSDIDTFHLTSIYQECEIKKRRLNTWIVSVIRRKVKHLHIDVWGDVGLRLPNRLFTCNSLTRMTLALGGSERWSITLPTDYSMCLPNLLTLQLRSVCFHDENLTNNFFLSCPKLEKLFLIDVEFLNMNVNVSCLKLRTLNVDNHGLDSGYCYWPNSKFKLHAPDLTYFRCNDFMSNHYILENLPSVVKVDIDMKVEDQNPELYSKLTAYRKQVYAQLMMQFLRALHPVEDLKLSAWFMEVLSGSPDLFEVEPTKLCYLTCLRLETWLSVHTICAIAYLLKISPSIKSLFVEIRQYVSENIGDYPETEVSLQCWLDKLEIVEIQGAVGCANELNFLEVLLKNAEVLNKLVIYTSKEDSPDREKRMTEFSKKLLLLPRASSNITILFF